MQVIRSFIIYTLLQIFLAGKANDEMDEECSKHERDENKYIILDGKPKVKRPISIHRN
jgi:hypothetical protein